MRASPSECQANIGNPQPSVCTGALGRDSPCGYLGPWRYCYGVCQEMANGRYPGQCDYQYRYTYISCSAYDTCISSDGPYLRAGQCGWGSACDSSGCTYSGI